MAEHEYSPVRRTPIDIPTDEFKRIGHELVDRIAELLAGIPSRPVTPAQPPSAVQQVLEASRSLPEHGTEPAELIDRASRLLMDHSLYNGHPRFWGYITSSPAPIGMLADFLASAVNPNLGSFSLAPMGTEIEAQTIRWIAELIGYPTECGGVMVSGGNMANFVGFLAARTQVLGSAVRDKGLGDSAGRPRVYCSAETHTWVQKAADLFGFGTEAIRWIPADGQQRMHMGRLRDQIAADTDAGDRPVMIIGSAGAVSTGAIDPLNEIADLCQKYSIWFHVDGAYGGFAAAAKSVADRFAGLERADSIAVDPHKWLYAPLEVGCALVRDPRHMTATFSYHPPYYHFGEEATNYVDFSMQNSRGFRALKVWLGLQQAGASGYREMIEEDMGLAKHLHDVIEETSQLEALTHNLSITAFRYVPADMEGSKDDPETRVYLNRLNEVIMERLEKSGEAYISKAMIGELFALRMCIVNFRTSVRDVEALPGIILRLGQETDREMRAEWVRSS